MLSTLLVAAISGITAGAPAADAPRSRVEAHALDDKPGAKHACKGKNDCKGQGGCKTDRHACKGKNDCKGQGGCNM